MLCYMALYVSKSSSFFKVEFKGMNRPKTFFSNFDLKFVLGSTNSNKMIEKKYLFEIVWNAQNEIKKECFDSKFDRWHL